MSPQSPKDAPPPPSPADAAGPEDALLTSEDLFGDLIDAPLAPKARASAAGSAPIRVQVSESGEAGPPKPKPPSIRAEEMGGLVDAFGGGEIAPGVTPSEAAAAEERAVSDDEPAPPVAPNAAAVPDAPQAEFQAAPLPALKPASPLAAAAEEDVSGLLNAIEAGVAESAPAPPVEAPQPAGGDDSLFAAALAFSERESGHDAVDDREGVRHAWVQPASRLETKFQASEGGAPPEQVGKLIDLAALAEDALGQPAGEAHPGARSGIGDVYGPYTLLERVAAGGMAEVFKAKRTGVEGFEKVVAVKRILSHLSDNKDFVEMFIDEAKVVAGLAHPNIVQIFDLGRLDETYFIAMEYVHGRDLRTILRRAKDRGVRMPLDLSAFVISRVCAALDHAHKRKDNNGRPMRIVHRDISPQNILISFEGEVKLTDFGIAKAATKATTTDRGVLRGKLLYMSPEQASGQPMDRRSDIFSLGIVFYEMVTDRKPFMATSERGILEMVRGCQIDPPSRWNSHVPERFESILMEALARDPADRYDDAEEMQRDLERALLELMPTGSQDLARLMEFLFEPDERGVREAPEELATPAEAANFEIDFEEKRELASRDEVLSRTKVLFEPEE